MARNDNDMSPEKYAKLLAELRQIERQKTMKNNSLFSQDSAIRHMLQNRRNAIVEKKPDFTPHQLDSSRTGATLELFLYGIIGEDWWYDGVSALEVATLLQEHRDAAKIVVHINSRGGDVFEGVAMYNSLVTHGAEIETVVDGLAASAAVIPMQAGSTRKIGRISEVMVHRSWTWAVGNSGELKQIADHLDQLDSECISLYCEKTGMDKGEMRDLFNGSDDADGTWLTAEKAVEMGFADAIESVEENEAAKAQAKLDVSQYEHLRVAAMFSGVTLQESKDKSQQSSDSTEKPTMSTETVTEQPSDTQNTDQNGDGAGSPAANDGAGNTVTAQPTESNKPASATFYQLLALVGGEGQADNFVVAQMKADATIEEARTAWTQKESKRADEAEAELAKLRTQHAHAQTALNGSETDPVSFDGASEQGGGSEADNKLNQALTPRMARYASALKVVTNPSKN